MCVRVPPAAPRAELHFQPASRRASSASFCSRAPRASSRQRRRRLSCVYLKFAKQRRQTLAAAAGRLTDEFAQKSSSSNILHDSMASLWAPILAVRELARAAQSDLSSCSAPASISARCSYRLKRKASNLGRSVRFSLSSGRRQGRRKEIEELGWARFRQKLSSQLGLARGRLFPCAPPAFGRPK